MSLAIFTPLVSGLLALATAPAPVSEGLILHLDAASQVQASGKRKDNGVWRNLVSKRNHAAGSAVLHNFPFDYSAGWVGTGQPGDPFALRFDGKRAYAEGPGNLEISEITIEVWGRVEGVSGPHGMRGATLLGTDYGKGGIGLLIAASGCPLLLHGTAHTPLSAETPLGQWTQVAITVAVRPHEAHLDVYSRPPRLLVGTGGKFREVPAARKGVQYLVEMPVQGTALLIWERIK